MWLGSSRTSRNSISFSACIASSEFYVQIDGRTHSDTLLKGRFSGLKSVLSGLKSALSGLKSALSGLESRLSGLKSALSGMLPVLSGLKFAFSGLKFALSDQVTRLLVELNQESWCYFVEGCFE